MWPLPLPRIFIPVACDDGSSVAPSSPKSPSRALTAITSLKDAVKTPESELRRWRRTFDTNAKTESGGEKYLDRDSFVEAIAPSDDLSKIGRAQFAILFKVADGSKRGLVSWDDFAVFQTLLKRPDADYWIAFQYFDVDASGSITFDEFKNVFSSNLTPDSVPFDFDCDWVKLYLGKKDGTHVLGYSEFTQLMKGLQGERLRQAFKYFDKDQDGFIRPDQFKQIILELAGHKLSNAVIERLPTLCTLAPGGKISYSEVIAFHNVIREMDMVERVIREAVRKSKDGRIDQSDFLNYAAATSRYNLFTPMEANIIFHFAGRGIPSQRLALLDFAQFLNPRWRAPGDLDGVGKAQPSTGSDFLTGLAKSAYSFVQGGFAGAFGATIVYPIDLVKTRMQNQRGNVVGQLLYRNSWDCVQKVFRNEGFAGFYRGVGPQLIGVAPEKAIKLTVNDLVRGAAMDPETGRIKLHWELIAGGCAGGSQVVFTNPLEIVKIRLQVQGEAAKAEGAVARGAVHIVRQLGLLGLYRGASACLLRDVPFSAIYFTAYNHMKKDVYHEGHHNKKLGFMETLISAAVAGMPAAYLTTPADVVKTRLQVEARKGETHYKGLTDAFVKISREEGYGALFKGGMARVLRSSPQFGFTLVAYEYLHKVSMRYDRRWRACFDWRSSNSLCVATVGDRPAFACKFDRRLVFSALGGIDGLCVLMQFPWESRPAEVHTVLTSGQDDMAKVRARNALKILLDVHGDIGRRSVS